MTEKENFHKDQKGKMKTSEAKKLACFSLTVKAAVINDEGKVLLLKRAKKENTNAEKYDLPGGHLEKGEAILAGLWREIKEETGLEIKETDIIKVSEYPTNHPLFNKIKSLRFIAFSQGRAVKLNAQEHQSYQWMKIDDAIKQFNIKDGFEKEKKETLEKAKQYLERKMAWENWKRALADLDNFKKRITKEKEEFRKYCLEGYILELLPILDNFEMSLAHVPEKEKESGWVTGLLHIKKQLEEFLHNQGVNEILVKKGDKLDERIHEVLAGKAQKGKIKKVLKKGYQIGEKVIRPAIVEAE